MNAFIRIPYGNGIAALPFVKVKKNATKFVRDYHPQQSKFCALAQPAEQRTVNAKVPRSIRGSAAKFRGKQMRASEKGRRIVWVIVIFGISLSGVFCYMMSQTLK